MKNLALLAVAMTGSDSLILCAVAQQPPAGCQIEIAIGVCVAAGLAGGGPARRAACIERGATLQNE